MNIAINKNSDVPMYKQIIRQITQSVKDGIINPGDKIPAEREMSKQLGVSRGTVVKAYEELERNNIIEVIQGKGSFISNKQDVIDGTRKDRAIAMIGDTIKNLEAMKFSHNEIKIFFDIILMEREKKLNKVNIVAIDCNYEALAIFSRQLKYISDVRIKKANIDDIHSQEEMEAVIEDADFVITTGNHIKEVNVFVNGRVKVVEAAVATSQQTIIDLSKISDGSNVGIICNSERFLGLIKRTLKDFDFVDNNIFSSSVERNDEEKIKKIFDKSNTLIIPAFSEIAEKYREQIELFLENGGSLINFEYQIGRGTLFYIEELISKVMQNKNKFSFNR